jgi:hypothetical protein
MVEGNEEMTVNNRRERSPIEVKTEGGAQ